MASFDIKMHGKDNFKVSVDTCSMYEIKGLQ